MHNSESNKTNCKFDVNAKKRRKTWITRNNGEENITKQKQQKQSDSVTVMYKEFCITNNTKYKMNTKSNTKIK